MILTVTPNPAVDHVYFVDGLVLNDTNRVLRIETDAGGKAVNVARVLAALGNVVVATGFVAGGNGAFVRHRLQAESVRHDFVDVAGETRSNVLVEDGSGRPPTMLGAPGPATTGLEVEALIAKIAEYGPQCSHIALGGSLPTGLEPKDFAALVGVAARTGARVVADADGDSLRLAIEAGADIVKPNAAEAGRYLGREVLDLAGAREAARRIQAAMRPASGAAVAIVSAGSLGAAMACPSGTFSGPAIAVEAKSTIGSGDSMVAGILHAMVAGMGPLEQLSFGLASGAATATTDGSRIASRDGILGLLPSARVTSGA
ncbi:MAG: 1-phosphofructokinase family hexose kinase [Fimbriimonadaceae bacterium]|nr:1-phosphofructokinase family hexose kinase [Fimbriimonadaceae bacterium]